MIYKLTFSFKIDAIKDDIKFEGYNELMSESEMSENSVLAAYELLFRSAYYHSRLKNTIVLFEFFYLMQFGMLQPLHAGWKMKHLQFECSNSKARIVCDVVYETLRRIARSCWSFWYIFDFENIYVSLCRRPVLS